MAFIKKGTNNKYNLEIEVFYSDIDIDDYDLEKEIFEFNSIGDLIAFMESKVGIDFLSMKG